jgi:hypothetical protein
MPIDVPVVAQVFLQVFLALLMLAAALPKLRAPDEFVGVVRNFRLLPGSLATVAGRVLPWMELALAPALLWSETRVPAAWITLALMLVFALAVAINLARGRREIDCGCLRISHGKGERISAGLVLRDLVFAAGAWLLTQGATSAPEAAAVWVGALFGLLALLLYLSLDWATAQLRSLPRAH